MAERIVSPGVFTQERDLSYLIPGIEGIGGAFIGPAEKGPAFIPTVVNSGNDFVKKFGEANNKSYLGYTVKNYLQEAAEAVVVRVLGTQGYDAASAKSALLYVSGSDTRRLFAVVHPSISGSNLSATSIAGDSSSFGLSLTGGTGTDSGSGFSLLSTSTSYIVDFFGTSPETAKQGYVYALFPDALELTGSLTLQFETSSTAVNFSGSAYSEAETPWIQSQTVGGQKYDLFKLHTINDGVVANKDIKVSFIGMKLDNANPTTEYGTFTLVVRKFDDTDARTEVLEQWDNLSLDPDSPNYIARRIGNSEPTLDSETNETYYQGEYRNNSSYIWVEMGSPAPAAALPYGFGKLYAPVVLSDYAQLPAPTFVTSRWKSGSVAGYNDQATDYKYYYGFDFSDTKYGNLSYLAPIPLSGSSKILVGSTFNLENVVDVPSGSSLQFSESISLTNADHLKYRRFTVPFQGGFDGLNPARNYNIGQDITATNTQGFDLTLATSAGSVAYKRALDSIRNPESIDISLLVLPGVVYELHPYIATEAISLCEEREDCFYIMDLTQYSATINTAKNKAAEIDSNYVGSYYPWVQIIDPNTNKYIWTPPSVVMPEVYAYNDNVGAEWFAPAGLNRGGIEGAVGVAKRLSLANRDDLYEAKVNPIAQFPGQGISAWGQKTLQRRSSALDRINVRRLLITVKKFIASSANYLVFEQNVEATRNRFLNIVNPYLASIQERSGLYNFRVVMDESNNTSDVIDRNILVGQLWLQPTKTAEYIILEFNVLPTGAAFSE
jgi:hypothetical protein